MKMLVFNRYSYLIFALCMLPTMFVDASSLNSPEDKYTLDVFSDEIVYIDLSRIKTRPDIRPSGPKRSPSKHIPWVEAWLQNGSLILHSDCNIHDVEITIVDENENVVLSSTVDILCGMDKKIDVSYFSDGTYTLLITTKKTTLYGSFEL